MKRVAFLVGAALLIVAGSGCSSRTSSSPTTTALTPDTTPPTTGTTPVTTVIGSTTVTATVTPPLDSAPPTSATTASTATSTDPTAPVACKSADLHLTLGETEGAMGNQYTPIIFTNTGSGACTLDGHPGVSFLDAAGQQVGASAERIPGPIPTVTLPAGAQAHATIDYHDPGFFDNCAPMPATSLRVFPPDETVAITIAFPSSVCTKPIPQAEVTIDVVRAGTSLP